MNQHERAKEAGVTPGKAAAAKYTKAVGVDPEPKYGQPTGYAQSKADFNLFADALNTMNQHGHTPSEMVEIIRELRQVLETVLKDIDDLGWPRGCSDIRNAIAKTEDFQ